ncbi:light-regulated signal transduction histidine kinase (bacteriophytochrome) [Gillisia sp. Hel_I_86]|uniref:ATP-binding protein n=1 Tax=Gillisia sp. Hel_I_86 TaxID=1249981 RepID=UPI00119A3A44|nr:ATP-binding protein [Gillisia sp. Hel_I_86]TVZ27675.1 light-regulated signal transduction histidine kinase (bacteriophytochrome) [Gillisia sp. Hel_I_86]
MDTQKTTITNCEKEPIHIIGQSQAHGVIVVCNPINLEITQCTGNVAKLLGLSLENLLGKNLSVLISSEKIGQIKEKLNNEKTLLPDEEIINQKKYFIIPHLSDSNLVLDFEPAGTILHSSLFQNQLTAILSEIESTQTIDEMCNVAVAQIKQLFEYDRVMMYKFDDEWNGEVIAEVKEERLESWLGLHYPARDIPKQARELFLKQGVRIIADVNFKPSKLIPEISPITNEPLDISKSELRGVSPIHIEYLKNMKVGASLTVAIILEGELWGLLACHHYAPKFINYPQRQTCRFLTQVFSNSLSVKTTKTFLDHMGASEVIRKELVRQMESIPNIKESLLKFNPKFTDIVECSGGALYQDGNLRLVGTTPQKEEVLDLLQNYIFQKEEELFFTKNLGSQYPKAKAYTKFASGLLSLQLKDGKNSYLLWFRPEISETVTWGGNPEKIGFVKEGIEYLSPRKSFEKWTQQNAGISKQWENYDLEAVASLQESITHMIVKKQRDEILHLNDQLIEANQELQTFSYSISHDLRAPLRGIDGYARILRDHHIKELDDYSKHAIETIVKSAEDMDGLIEDILTYSSVGKNVMKPELISIEKLVEDIVVKHNLEKEYPNTKLQLAPDMPKIEGDKRMISQLINNLISNAFKYSAKVELPLVEVGYLRDDKGPVFFVKDNGIGIDPSLNNKIFDVFSRLVGEEYSGSGIGLAIVKKVIDIHKGTLRVESEPNKGAGFYFTFPDWN